MKVDVYILGLFVFKGENEESVVFSDAALDEINTRIENYLGVERINEKNTRWKKYILNKGELIETLKSASVELEDASMGYYHHRVIFKFELAGQNLNEKVRELRKVLKNYADQTIQNAIVTPNKDYRFDFCYTYPLVVVREGIQIAYRKKDHVFSDDTTTLTFEINEPRFLVPIGKKYNIRISIPSTIIYTKNKISNDVLKAMINAIYQYCLYKKKEKFKEAPNPNIELGEDQLVQLWQYIIDTMGGKTLDKNIAKISETNYFVALAAFVIALVAFDLGKLQSNLTYLKDLFFK
jgi:hypothetical protein